MRATSLFFALSCYGFSSNLNYVKHQVDNILHFENQKNVYNKIQQSSKKDINIYTPLKYNKIHNNIKDGKCFVIEHIDISDIKLLNLDDLIQEYKGKCLVIKDIVNLTNKINNIYIKKSYITSKAYIKEQDLSKKVLKISAIEGRVNRVINDKINASLVFIGYKDKNLNLRDLESRVEQLNKLQSVKTTMKLIPSKKTGYSNIKLINKKVGNSFHGNLALDNFGSKNNGKYNISLNAGYDNVFNLADLIEVGINATNKNDSNHKTRTYSIKYSIPIGKNYLTLKYSKMKYAQLVDSIVKSYKATGSSKSISMTVEHKLFHTKKSRANLNFALSHTNNKNYLEHEFLKTSSTISTIFTFGYTYKYNFSNNWDISTTFEYHRGLKWFGATTRTKLKPTFNKLTMDLLLNKKIPIGKRKNISLTSALHAQYANKNILSSQFISIGGIYSVRGFKSEAQLSGNKGFYIRNDIAYNFSIDSLYLSPYIGYDYGKISRSKRNYSGAISSYTLGLRANYKDFNLDMFYSKPIKDSNKIKYQDNGDPIIHKNKGIFGLKLSYRF